MKKRLSIKARITIWYASVLLMVCAAAIAMLAMLTGHAEETYSRDTLRSAAVVLMDEMDIEHGILEIDSDMEDVPNVYASLFDTEGNLIYGRRRVNLPLEHDTIRKTQWNGHSWYVHDVLMEIPQIEPTWLRLYLSLDVSSGMHLAVVRHSVWLLPLIVLLAIAGGYLITARAFHPVKTMTALAASIADGGDLSKRIDMPKEEDGDELGALASTFNAMLERLQRAFEHERRFTSDAAHELRTPLNAIRVQGEYALGCEDIREKDEAIARMLEKSEEMQTLAAQLLLLARMESGQIAMQDECALDEIIGEIVQDMELVAGERGIRIETELESLNMRGSRSMIARAVINLTDNAIRYGKENGTVRISLQKDGKDAVIAVSDDGKGIAPDALEHVFERFWRADEARSTQGTGIGLSIVQAVAAAHGGSVCAESEPGKGSRFTLRLPLEKSTEKS